MRLLVVANLRTVTVIRKEAHALFGYARVEAVLGYTEHGRR